MKINKNIKIFINYFLGPVLFIWLTWSIYNQIAHQSGLHESWQHIRASLQSQNIFYLIAVIILMFVQWGVEAYKWRLAIKQVETISFLKAYKAIMSGISFSITTPNNVGDYFGRVLYLDEGHKIKAISLTVIANMSQLLVTLCMGFAALLFFKDEIVASQMISALWMKVLLYGTGVGLMVFLLCYFGVSWIVKLIDRIPAVKKFIWIIQAIENYNVSLLLRFIVLSIIKIFIVILQYYLLFKLFHINVNFIQAWQGLSVMFLIMSVIPSIAVVTDLGLKNEVSLKLLSIFSNNHLGISLATATIWLVNLIIPALIGSLLILGIRNIIQNENT